MSRRKTVSTVLAVMQVLVLLIAPVAATAPTGQSIDGTALQTEDGEVRTADTIYVRENGDAVLAYNESSTSEGTGQIGVNMTSGLVHLLVATETDSATDVSGQGSVVMTPDSIAGNGSLAMPQPDTLQSLSLSASGVQNEKRAKMDATLTATIDRRGSAAALSSAHTDGHVTMDANSLSTSGTATVKTAMPMGSDKSLSYAIEETANGYVLDGKRSGTVHSYERDDWSSRSAAKAHLRSQYARTAENFGGSAQVTIDRYDYSEDGESATVDVEYTVRYSGIKDGVARALTQQLAQSSEVDLSQSEARTVASKVKKLEIDHVQFAMSQRENEMNVEWDAKVENYDGALFAALEIAKNVDSEQSGLQKKDIQRLRKTLQAQQSANLQQKVTWTADLSSTGSGTAAVDAEVHYRTQNWDAYVNALKEKGVTVGSSSFEVTANSDGDEVTAEASFELNQQKMISRAVDSAATSLDPTADGQTMRLLKAFQNSEFKKAKMSANVKKGTVTVEAGAKFDNISAMRDAFAGRYGGAEIAGIAGRSNEDTTTTYVYVKDLVGENATKSDVEALAVANDDTEVLMPGEWDREFPSMDQKSVAGYLGVQYQSGNGNNATDGTTTATTTSTDGQPGFGLAVTLAALAGVALLARRD